MTAAVESLKKKELDFGLLKSETYVSFQTKADNVKHSFLSFLLEQKRMGKKITAYGAAAKGNTLLNYCGIKGTDCIEFVVDASPHKQGKFLPGSHISIVSEKIMREEKPDIIVIIPWNIKDEIVNQLNYARYWGAKFVITVPNLEVF